MIERAVSEPAERPFAVASAQEEGRTRFLGVDLLVAKGALVPRPETELLGRAAIDGLSGVATPRVIDMCCGSGNLACAIAMHLPAARVWAADLTLPAVELARRNVELLELGGRVDVFEGDLFAALAGLGLEGSIDAIVCNPPYISTRRLNLRGDLLAHEPREAFDGGAYGLSIHQRVVAAALAYLRPGGTLLVEHGAGQDRQLVRLFERASGYGAVALVADALGTPRVAYATKTE